MGITQFEIVPTSPVYEEVFRFDEESDAENPNFEQLGYETRNAV